MAIAPEYAAQNIAKREHNPESFASVASEANACMIRFVGRLEQLTDRLCGGQPSPADAAGQKIHGLPNGHFEEAAEASRSVMMQIEAANRHLDRIERALP